MRSARVLVVDDYEPFRQFVCSTLGKIPGLRIVGQASDGVEAVSKAEELQPELILMDIGLPSLSGIEAARRIRQLAPTSKVLFLSQETSRDVVEEALRLGASGYIVKAHAGSELLAAVEVVLRGEQLSVVEWRITFLPSLGVHRPLAVAAPRKHSRRLHPRSHKRAGSSTAIRCNSILTMRRC